MLSFALAHIVPIIPWLHVPKFPNDQGIPRLGELGGRNPAVLDDADSKLTLCSPLVPILPEPLVFNDPDHGLQVLNVNIEGEALALLGHAPGVGGGETDAEIEDEGAVEVAGLGDGAEETTKIMRHGLAPVAAAKVREVLARGELGARERGRGRRGGGVGPAAAGLAGEGAGVVFPDGGNGVGAGDGVAGDGEAAVVLVVGGGGGSGAPGHVAGGRRRVAGDGAAEAVEVDVGEGVDGAAHHEVEELRVGAVERGGGVAAGLILLLQVGRGGRQGGGGRGEGDGEVAEGEEEEGDEQEGGGGVGGGGDEGAPPQQRPARVHPATATADGDEIWWLIV